MVVPELLVWFSLKMVVSELCLYIYIQIWSWKLSYMTQFVLEFHVGLLCWLEKQLPYLVPATSEASHMIPPVSPRFSQSSIIYTFLNRVSFQQKQYFNFRFCISWVSPGWRRIVGWVATVGEQVQLWGLCAKVSSEIKIELLEFLWLVTAELYF